MIPKYIKLKEQLSEDILKKKYPLYSKLPTENELAQAYNVSRATVRRALDFLAEDGIIEKRWGSGNIVVSTGLTDHKNEVALILPNRLQKRFALIIEDISASLYKEGLRLSIHTTDNKLSKERQILTELLRDSYAAVFSYSVNTALPNCNTDLYLKLLRRQTPVIFLYNAPSQIYNPLVIATDDYSAGYQLGRRFIMGNYENFDISFSSTSLEGIQCYNGFIDAYRDTSTDLPEDNIYLISDTEIEMTTVRINSGQINPYITKSIGAEAVRLLSKLRSNRTVASVKIPWQLD
ncbi:MAG: GntR family transcriptional regulator [Pseudobutyrivibrio sp.]|nr:GntR family transcriptional regulator [Pseudobutyrivibrio sp.]